MQRLRICIVGCGGMGTRHLAGYAALRRVGLDNADVVGVCDLNRAAAQTLAGTVADIAGTRPTVYTDITEAIAEPAVQAFDLVTDPDTHHLLGVPALLAGKHVICEKPLGLTVRAAHALIDAARAGGSVLATAENYRRGNGNRVARAVLDAGLLGEVHLMIEQHIGGTDSVIITPWRHDKLRGAIGLDMGVHLTDVIAYLLGPIESGYGTGLIAEPVRRSPDGTAVTATGEDSVLGYLRMASGVGVQLAYLPSGPGASYTQRSIHGRAGSMRVPGDRTGGDVVVRLGDEELSGAALLDRVPPGAVSELNAALFGSRTAGYDLDFPHSDAAHLAVELHDFADAVLEDGTPEVDGAGGLHALAAVYAVYESGLTGRAVRVADVESGELHGCQDEIDAALGLLDGVPA